jgi:dihydropteroate synthase
MFKIVLNRTENALVAIHYVSIQMDKPISIIKGKTAESVYSKIVEMGLVTKLDHAAYLGSELAKAEIALRTGKDYIQDSPLFRK